MTVVEGSDRVLLDLHLHTGLNVGVFAVLLVVDSPLFAPTCYLMGEERQNDRKKAAKKEKEGMIAMSKQRSRLGLPKEDN